METAADRPRQAWRNTSSCTRSPSRSPINFWGRQARDLLTWFRDFETVHSGSLANGDNAWFVEGQLNASYNCVDRHAFKNPDKVAIIYEADEPGDGRTLTYGELLREVCKVAHVLKKMGVRRVTQWPSTCP